MATQLFPTTTYQRTEEDTFQPIKMGFSPWDIKEEEFLEETEHQAEHHPMEEDGHHGSEEVTEGMQEVDNHPMEVITIMEEDHLAEEDHHLEDQEAEAAEDHHMEDQEVEAAEETLDPHSACQHRGRVLYTNPTGNLIQNSRTKRTSSHGMRISLPLHERKD
jgi:hypothetical protein